VVGWGHAPVHSLREALDRTTFGFGVNWAEYYLRIIGDDVQKVVDHLKVKTLIVDLRT
jgi:hypothetical protein